MIDELLKLLTIYEMNLSVFCPTVQCIIQIKPGDFSFFFFLIRRGYTRQPYLGKCKVYRGKRAFHRVTDLFREICRGEFSCLSD